MLILGFKGLSNDRCNYSVKVNSCSFFVAITCNYSMHQNNVVKNFPGVEFLGTTSKFRNMKEIHYLKFMFTLRIFMLWLCSWGMMAIKFTNRYDSCTKF